MPSPIGHALGAVAVGWAIDGRSPSRTTTIACIVASLAPDLDLLAGSHRSYTHSIGAVALVFVSCWAATRFADARRAAAIAAAWGSHLLLDWLGSDTSAPIGIMALWPFTSAHYQSGLYLFDAISRRYWLPEQFVWGNLRAAAREVLILGPITGLCYWITDVRQPRRREEHRERTE